MLTIKANAQAFAGDILPIIDTIRDEGHISLRQIAAELTARGIKTARGGEWSAKTVRDVIARQTA